MARRTNYGFNKRQKEKQKAEKAELKREKKRERKEAEEAGEIAPEDDLTIAPIDPADLGLDDKD
jgi:hypothetical protein